MNNRFADMVATSPDASTHWRTYGVSRANLNHLRTLGLLATALCFLVANLVPN